jgi:hypothetical protein
MVGLRLSPSGEQAANIENESAASERQKKVNQRDRKKK